VYKERASGTHGLVTELRSSLWQSKLKVLTNDHWKSIIKKAKEASLKKPKLSNRRVVDEDVEVENDDPDDEELFDPMFDGIANKRLPSDDSE
jgi:hypothetical protein